MAAAPFIAFHEHTNDGDPAVGYLLYTYIAGTTTKLATYSEYTLGSANTNPIVLDSAGRATIYLLPAVYKFVLAPPTDSDPPVSPIWTRDYVSAVPELSGNIDVSGYAGETITENEAAYLSDGSGGQTAGKWYLTSSSNSYSSRGAHTIGIALQDLTAGASSPAGLFRVSGRLTGYPSALSVGSAYYLSATPGALTVTASDATRIVAQADTATSLVISNWPLQPPATSALSGLLTATTQTIAGAKTFSTNPVVTKGAVAAPVMSVLHVDSAAYKKATPDVGGETGWSFQVPAGALASADALIVEIAASAVGVANTQTELRLLFGETPLIIAWRFSDNATKISGKFSVLIQRRAATSCIMSADGVSLAYGSCTPYVAGTATFANALMLHTTHGTGATGTDYMQQESVVVYYLKTP